MADIVVTGHGNFATGVCSSLNLIAGEQEGVVCVDFLESHSTQELENNLEQVIKTLSDEILVLSDLAGGSPFKSAVLLSQSMKNKNIKVISGTNLAMLLECSLSKSFMSLDELVQTAINSGKDAVSVFEIQDSHEEEESEDGI